MRSSIQPILLLLVALAAVQAFVAPSLRPSTPVTQRISRRGSSSIRSSTPMMVGWFGASRCVYACRLGTDSDVPISLSY